MKNVALTVLALLALLLSATPVAAGWLSGYCGAEVVDGVLQTHGVWLSANTEYEVVVRGTDGRLSTDSLTNYAGHGYAEFAVSPGSNWTVTWRDHGAEARCTT